MTTFSLVAAVAAWYLVPITIILFLLFCVLCFCVFASAKDWLFGTKWKKSAAQRFKNWIKYD